MITMQKARKLTTNQFYEVRKTIENHCCNYIDEQCMLYDDGEYPLCPQHGLSYLICPYFISVVAHNNQELMVSLFEISKDHKRCRECGEYFLPRHRSCQYCPECAPRIEAEKSRIRSQNYRDRKKAKRHGC